eukprot:scaffold195666_cov36-Cyclotella_meneghiniana.AAC.1
MSHQSGMRHPQSSGRVNNVKARRRYDEVVKARLLNQRDRDARNAITAGQDGQNSAMEENKEL